MRTAMWVSGLCVMGLHVASAADTPVIPASLGSCRVLTDDAARLQCYDTVTGRTPTQRIEANPAPAAEDERAAGRP